MTDNAWDPKAVAETAADRMEANREQILEAYEQRLLSTDSLLARDTLALQQTLTNASHIISDVVASIRVGAVHVDENYHLIAWEIGVTRAADGVHPKESLQAASAFFQTALELMAKLIDPGPGWIDEFMLVALALEESLTLRVRESISSYAGFLLKQVHGAQITERRRIARELHDRIGNSVSVAHRQLELFELYRSSQPAKANAKFHAARTAIKESMDNLRTVASDLHAHEPLQNLEKALRSYLNAAETGDTAVRLVVNGDETWAPATVLDEALLIIREAVGNALRYAGARVVLIDVEVSPDELRATVQDDGCGFDVQTYLKARRPAPASGGGVGLMSMMERAELLNGSLQIRSRVGQGTKVELWVPLKGRSGVVEA